MRRSEISWGSDESKVIRAQVSLMLEQAGYLCEPWHVTDVLHVYGNSLLGDPVKLILKDEKAFTEWFHKRYPKMEDEVSPDSSPLGSS
jgi:hypothetical protein